MKNGYTLLFHFEKFKSVQVKVFDREHKLIAEQKHPCEFLDINTIDLAKFKNLIEINGEAVLFMEQPYLARESLIRIRFNGETGRIIKEEIIGRSGGGNDPVDFFVVKEAEKSEYAVLTARDIFHHPGSKTELNILDGKTHESIRKAELNIPGTFTFTSLNKIKVENGIYYCISSLYLYEDNKIKGAFLACSRLLPGDTAFSTRIIEMSPDETFDYSMLSYNDFAQAENLFVLNTYKTYKQVKGYTFWERHCQSYFCPFSTSTFQPGKIVPVSTGKLEEVLYSKLPRDTIHNALLYPQLMHTNKNGASIVIYQEKSVIPKKSKMDYTKKLYGNIGISILNDDGAEVFATAIPQRQYVFSEDRDVFNYYQIDGFSFIPSKTSYYIITNIHKDNFDRQVGDSLSATENTDASNTICYKIGKNRSVTRSWLLGTPTMDADNYALLSCCDFAPETNTYAVLVHRRKGDKTESCLAWCTLPQE
ncbi:hypothetical protein ACTHGU_16315 [Chitinophagaceae bacterium MMS25-I14]